MCRMLAETVEPHGVLLLVGRKAESSEALRRAAARILERLSKASGNGPETSPAESEPVEVSRPSQRRPAV